MNFNPELNQSLYLAPLLTLLAYLQEADLFVTFINYNMFTGPVEVRFQLDEGEGIVVFGPNNIDVITTDADEQLRHKAKTDSVGKLINWIKTQI